MIEFDHFILAAPDLDAAKTEFADLSGCMPVDGGVHLGLGTRNALCSFHDTSREQGTGSYLEIIAPDPQQPNDPDSGGILRTLTGLTPLHWAVRTDSLPNIVNLAHKSGLTHGPVRNTSRQQPDGQRLDWQTMRIRGHNLKGVMPFFINWMDCPHPSTTTPFVGIAKLVVSAPTNSFHQLLGEVAHVELRQGEPEVRMSIATMKGKLDFKAKQLVGF